MKSESPKCRVLFVTLACCFLACSSHAAPGTIQFSQPVFTSSEAGPIASTDANGVKYLTPTMTVTRTGGSTGALTVDYCVWPDETVDNANEYNYVAYGNVNGNYAVRDNTRRWVSAGTLTWADGDTAPKTLPFSFLFLNNPAQYTLCAASAIQGTITYSARITNVIGGATLGGNATAKLEVTDAEAPAAGVLNLTARRFYGTDGGSAVISVRRDGGTTGSVSVNYATSSTLPAVGANQAAIGAGVASTHYTTTTGTLTWADGDSAVKTFTVPLPATGNTNGALNVAVNLSAPTNSAVLGTVASALLTIQNKASTVYDINDNTDGSTYRVSLPPGTDPVRGILFWWPGTNGDDRHFTTDPNFRKIADQWRFAIVSPKGNYDSSPNAVQFSQPKLAFLFDRLSQIAKTTGRPEIINAPFVLSGMSAGAYSTSSSLCIWPERTIAAIAQEGWTGFPFSAYYPNFTAPPALAQEIPALNLGGQLDLTQSPPSSTFPAMNGYRARGLTRSAVAMCWGRNHTFGNTGATYNSVALYWLDQVMASGRYLPAQTPTASDAPVLGSLPIANGWWGARNCTNTASYGLSGGSSSYLNIGSDAAFTGVKDVSNALVDSWLPTESAARAYRAFVSLPTITFSTPAQFTSGLTGVPTTLAISENGFGSGLTKVEFYENNTKIGEDTTSPYTLTWTPTVAGARNITAVASDGSGPKYTAFTLFLASDPVAPTITAGQTNSGVLNLPFSYQLAAGGPPTSYALASGSLPAGVTLNTSTGLLSGTPSTSGTFTPTFTATNSLGTSSAVTVTLNIAATAGVIISEPFAYTIGTNAPDPDAGLNGSNGLPATNVGGNPSGISTGLRGDWGITTDVVAGLSYTQGTKTFTTSGGAGRVNNATWGGNPYIYRFMTTDPFLAQRIGASNNGSLGVDGSSLFVSFLASTSSAAADAFRFSLRYDGSANFYVSNTATGWSLNGNTATNAPLALNTPTLIVLRFDFAAGATDSVSMWVNPALGAALGTPNATVSALDFPGINNFTTRPSVANAMTLDELRIGTSLAAVTPYTEPAAPFAPSALSANADSASQITLSWTDNSADETGFKVERSPDGTTGWTQIAPPPANATSYADTGLSAGTTYHYRVRATNAVGDSAYTLNASATTPNAAPVITASQAATGGDGLAFSYQIVALNSPTSYALASGMLPAGITLNTTTGLLSGSSSAVGTYPITVTATNAIGTSPAVALTITIAPGSLIIAEPFAYTVGDNAPDPDAGLNSGNGLPATNVGGNSSGTRTGLRGTWGTTTDVVAGLAYTQGAKTLTTTDGAGRVNNATWGGQPYVYQGMSTDPFLAERIGGVNNGNFGIDGTSLYVSFLASASSAAADAFRLSFKYDGSANFYVSNTATTWSLNGIAATGVPLALNTPTLIVLRFDFAAGATDTVSMWVNPTLGSALGTPNATVAGISFPGLQNFQTRAAVANAMTFDELRVGTTFGAVTPYTDSIPAPVISSNLAQSGTAGSALSYTITASNTPISYNATGLPSGLNINTSTGVISGTPSVPGTTNTTISATNATGTGSATLVFTIASAPTALESFRSTAGLASDGSQDLLSPAGDGVANLLKYAFNMLGNGAGQVASLATPNAAVLTLAGSAGLPFINVGATAPDTGKLQIAYIRRKASASPAPGVSYSVQFSNDLGVSDPWALNPSATESTTSIDATFERVTVTDSTSVATKRFARVRVTAP